MLLLNDILFCSPFVFLAFCAIYNLLYFNLFKKLFLRTLLYKMAKFATVYTLIGLSLLSINSTYIYYQYFFYKVIFLQYSSLKLNIILITVQLAVVLFCLVVVIISARYNLKYMILDIEFDALVLFVVFGILLLIMANDLIVAYVAVELQSLPFYILLSLPGKNIKAIDSSLKYFIMSIIASAVLVFGLAILYYITGLTNFDDLALFFFVKYSDYGIAINYYEAYWLFMSRLSALLIIVALLFKLTAAPFHYWVIDIYENSPLSAVLLLTTVAKLSFIMLFYNFYNFVFAIDPILNFLQPLLLFVASFSVAIGTFGAYFSGKLPALLGYGGIAHIGFVIVSLAINSTLSQFTALIYFAAYIVTTLVFFMAWFSIFYKQNVIYYFKQFVGMSVIFRATSIVLTVACFSFAGLPPFLGFIVKLMVMQDLINLKMSGFVFLFFIISLLSAAYYLRLIKVIWFDLEPSKRSTNDYFYTTSLWWQLLLYVCLGILVISPCILLVL